MLLSVDRELTTQYGLVCGVDEAGRGPLAGPVYAAAVILPEGLIIKGLDDSKKLSEKKREGLYDEITEKALAYSVAFATEAEIDEINILQATFLAMDRAVKGLFGKGLSPGLALIDGNRSGALPIPCRCIVGGDGIYSCIAAASILAKVSRDRLMLKLAEQYPAYEFNRHKGYGTALHYQKIKEYGPSPIHRMSFLKKLH
jgi:ribonuclease HII